jgi:hypothetical protein
MKTSAKKGADMKSFTRQLSFFILPLSSFILLVFCGCRTSGPPKPPKEIVDEIPPQVLLQLQVIALREVVNPSDESPFPALGFQFAEDRVVPVEKPDTIAGVELTTPQLIRWMENLRKAGATLYVALPPFAVGPNLRASTINSAEKQYQANWRVDSNGASAQNAAITPESKFDVQPELVPGTRDLLTSVGAEISSADLDPFTLVDRFTTKDEKAIPLALLLPRQAIRRMITQTLVQPGRTLILAHYVKQYRSASQPPQAAENLRDHLFYVLSADRRGPEVQSDLPIVPQIPPRYALSLTWLESENARPAAQPPDRAAPALEPASDDLIELQKAAGLMKDAPGAVLQTLSLALTAKTQAQFEIAEERDAVAGIHRDSDEATSPYNFLIHQTWTGMKLSAQLEQTPQGVSANLNLRLADPPQCDDAVGWLPSLRAGAPETEAKEYHFQIASQTSADFAAIQALRPGQTRLLPLTWQTTGIAAPHDARLRQVAVSLAEASAPAAETAPQGSAPGAPVHP